MSDSQIAKRLLNIWCCPRCKQQLAHDRESSLCCKACAVIYPCFDGIPDLRVEGKSWINQEQDRAMAVQLIRETEGFSTEQLLKYVFRTSKDFTAKDIETRTRQVIAGIERLRGETGGWLKNCFSPMTIAMDLGCGPGQLIAAAAGAGTVIGVDVRLLWLLVAKRLIAEHGGTPVLAAGMAESLPLADDSLDAVVSLDVIEHVGNVKAYLKEINRVTAPGGKVALSTPNRFSLAAEPHVGVWGVGWLPRPWQKEFVRIRSGKSYESTSLLSVRETRRLFKDLTEIDPVMIVPPVPEHEIDRFPTYRKVLAKIYNGVAPHSVCRPALLAVGPFFRVLGVKRGMKRPAAHPQLTLVGKR